MGVMSVQLLVFVLYGACFSFSRTKACMDMFVQPQKKKVTFKNTTKKKKQNLCSCYSSHFTLVHSKKKQTIYDADLIVSSTISTVEPLTSGRFLQKLENSKNTDFP